MRKHCRIRRIAVPLLCALLTMGACASDGTASELTALRSELDAAVSELNALRDELSAAEARLDEARAQNDALTHRVEDLEAAGEYPIFRRTLSNGVTLIYETQLRDIAYDPLEERRAHELYVRFADGEKRLLGSSVSSIGVSPDETRLLYNVGFSGSADSGDGSESGSLWLLDFATREETRLRLNGMSNQHTPAYADWLDDRYVLFIEQLASGSFTVGGDLCVYDTETDTYRRLTDTAKDGFQICSFEIEGRDYLAFDCVQYDEAMMPWHSQAMLAMAELYDVIRSGGTVDLRS